MIITFNIKKMFLSAMLVPTVCLAFASKGSAAESANTSDQVEIKFSQSLPQQADPTRAKEQTDQQNTPADIAKDVEKQEGQVEEQKSDGQVYRLDPVEVRDRQTQAGQTILDGERINLMPSGTGSINDALRGNSSVQFDLNSRNGLTGGEITPPKISIRGGRPYENNFMINGVGNNNNINPGGFEPDDASGSQPQGDPQAFFLDRELVGNLTVYTENIPVEYGSFLGGAVNATIRDARSDRWHTMSKYRHTRNQWTQQHFHPDTDPEDIDSPSFNAARQSRFDRHDFAASADGPITEKLAAMLYYGQKYSSIPLHYNHVGFPEKTQYRTNENFLIRLNTSEIDDFKGALTLSSQPYTQEMFNSKTRGSDYDVVGGGYLASYEMENSFKLGKLTTALSYQKSEVSRDGSGGDSFSWRKYPNGLANPPSIHANWDASTSASATSSEGGIADYTQEQESYTIKNIMKFEKFGSDNIKNDISLGYELERTFYHKNRAESRTLINGVALSNVQGSLADGIIAGEQYLSRMNVHESLQRDMDVTNFAVFLEDTITIERLTLRPGLRASYDSVGKNNDLAPRFFANVDVLNNGVLNIHGGASRYYGNQIVSAAFYSAGKNKTYNRTANAVTGIVGDWGTPTGGGFSSGRLSDLKTPYSDELALGLSLNVFDTTLKLSGVKRDNKDQLRAKYPWPAPTVGNTSYIREMTNEGETTYEGLTLTLEKSLDFGKAGRHSFALGATYSKTESNADDFSSAFSEYDAINLTDPNFIYMDGEKVLRSSLPATNFNSPLVYTLDYTGFFWEDRLRLASILRYEMGGEGIKYGKNYTEPNGDKFTTAWTSNYKDFFTCDLGVEFDVFKHKEQTLTFTLDVLNLFDNKNGVDTDTSANSTASYTMGRQFWAGVKYEF